MAKKLTEDRTVSASQQSSWAIMAKLRFVLICSLAAVLLNVSSSPGQLLVRDIETQRLAQTGMKFLAMSVDPRAAAMGDALTAQEVSSAAMFYNPAGMARMNSSVHAWLGQVQWIAGFAYNAGAVAYRPADGRYGVVGVSLLAADYGEFLETVRADTENGYRDLGTFSPSAMSAGLSYARALTDRFSVGGNVKYVSQALGAATMSLNDAGGSMRQNVEQSTVAVDFGVLYHTGFRSLNFAFSARNFSQELTYAEESFELPLNLRIGLSMDLMDLTPFSSESHSLLMAVDAQRPRDYSEQLKAGLEYTFMNLVSLRGGYVFPHDERGLNMGAGLQTELADINFGFDYSYTAFGTFGSINRLAVQVGL